MPSFTLYDLNPEFWQRVQAKAAAEGSTVKAVILRLLAAWLAAMVLISVTGCAYKNPTAPTMPPDGPQAGVPARIELGVVAGVGAFGGTATINVRVIDGWATALPDQTVTVTASAGELSASSVVTDAKGMGRVTITGPVGPTITIVAAAGAVSQKTLVALQAKPDGPPQ
jgi:hypothetical protein